MNLADAFARAYDALQDTPGNQLDEWMEDAWELADQIEAEALTLAEPPPAWLELRPGPDAVGVLLALHAVLQVADPDRDQPSRGLLEPLWAHYQLNGNLMTQPAAGALIFRRASAPRPSDVDHPSRVGDLVPALVRVPEHLWRVAQPDPPERWRIRGVDDLRYPLVTNLGGGDAGSIDRSPLTVAQLPFLAAAADVVWSPVSSAGMAAPNRYAVRPNSAKLTRHVNAARTALRQTQSELAILPETSLDDLLFARWTATQTARAVETTRRWLLIGSGPVTQAGPTVAVGGPLPNRAVLVTDDGTVLLTQDKRCGFTLQPEQQRRYGIVPPLPGTSNLGESIAVGVTFSWLDASAGRFAVTICEEFNRLFSLSGPFVDGLSITHLLVPVIAPAMFRAGWQARDARALAEQCGCVVVVANSLAIQPYFPPERDGGHAVTLIAAIPPEGGRYGDAVLMCLPTQQATLPTRLRANALTPRTARLNVDRHIVDVLLTLITSLSGPFSGALVSFQELAEASGTTLEVVSQVARALSARDLIFAFGSSIVIQDIDGLRAFT